MTGGSDEPRWVQQAVEQHERPLLGYALRLTGNIERARDVVQETFARLCRQSPAQLNGTLAQWLYTVCRNCALDARRKERRAMSMVESASETFPSPASGPDLIAETNDASSLVLQLLERLPENQQEVIRLKFQHGMSYRQISQITGNSEGYVGFLIHTGIKTLRTQMTKQ